ncbi:hypothetical protein ES043_16115 [Polaribacter sp. IC063]|nr:hypothetical protein ES043_16115 [Polaribacter sp. IC063]
MKTYKIFFLLLFISVSSFAQNSNRIFKSATLGKGSIILTTKGSLYRSSNLKSLKLLRIVSSSGTLFLRDVSGQNHTFIFNILSK